MASYYIMRTGYDEQHRALGYEKVRIGKNGQPERPIEGYLVYSISHSEEAADSLLAGLRGEAPMPRPSDL